MAQPKSPRFSQATIEAIRDTKDFAEWNRNFEKLKSSIMKHVSPRDLTPIVKAGADQDRVLTMLAFAVDDDSKRKVLPRLMANRKALASLANQLETVAAHASRIVSDPLCDGRFWIALEGLISWGEVPQAGVIEAPVLERMRDLARLVKDRSDALGRVSRSLKKFVKNRSIATLSAYILHRTNQPFDREIAFLLEAAYKACLADGGIHHARRLGLSLDRARTKTLETGITRLSVRCRT